MTPVFDADHNLAPSTAAAARAAAREALSVLMPVTCAGCGVANSSLCALCRRECVPVGFRQTIASGLVVLSALRYEGRVRRAILEFKEQGRTDAAPHLAWPFAAVVASAARDDAEIVAVPPNRLAFSRRGYDPVALLAHHARLNLVTRLLVRPAARNGQKVGSQKVLGGIERAMNAENSLTVRHSVAGRKFLLIDDVVTTGSTLREAARALQEAGGEVIGAATLAVTFKRIGVL